MRILWLLCAMLISNSLFAATFYLDPINGDINNDGSLSAPWPTLQALIDNGRIASNKPANYPYTVGQPLVAKNVGATVQPGDTLYCLGGFQGSVFISSYYNLSYIHVIGLPGHQVEFSGIELRGSSHWSFDNITISKEFDGVYGGKLFFMNTHSFLGAVQDVEIKNSTLYTKWDAYSWSAADWVNNVAGGISSSYPIKNVHVYNNYIRNIATGVQIVGEDVFVENNTIENFSVDGLRGNGDRLHFYYNLVMTSYNVDANHDDLFQSFNLGTGTHDDCFLVGNILIGANDPNQPVALRGDAQGIGMFDGFFENWTIINNVVAVNHWHGISLLGARNCLISNNTVTKIDISHPNSPWIRVAAHKDGRPSINNTITNNVFYNAVSNQDGTTANNFQLNTAAEYDQHFVDWRNNNFHLLPTSSLIDAGIATGAPAYDRDSIARPIGAGYDIGAYEYCSTQNCATPPCVVNAGVGTIYSLCDTSATNTLNLFTQVSGNPQLTGTWSDLSNSGALSGASVTLPALTAGTFVYQYVVSESCGSDTAVVTVEINSCNPNCAAFVPIVDGSQETGWNNTRRDYIRNPLIGTVTNKNDLSGYFKLTWDNSFLYVIVDVQDDLLVNDQSTSVVQDDGVSLYIDGGNEKATSYDTNDHNFTFRWNDPNIRHNNGFNPPGVTRVETATAGGYLLEVSIPWTFIGVMPAEGNAIGIDIHINDDDDGGQRDKKISWFGTVDQAWTNPSVLGDYTLNSACFSRRVICELGVLLEGIYDQNTAMMGQDLYTKNLLPGNHPYHSLPWNYNGGEGQGWTMADYPQQAVDWVLISFREAPAANTEIGKAAVVVLTNGTLMPFTIGLPASLNQVYIVVEHRNHLPAMSPQLVPIVNNQLIYDFRFTDSYSNIGFGQKLIGNNYCLFAGNGDPNEISGSDINGQDRIIWQQLNGTFNQYLMPDFDLDGDVSGKDRILWDTNNGIFSDVEK